VKDTQKAIEQYKGREASYLETYGVLQALYVQQNSVVSLELSLGLEKPDYNNYPLLKEIRQIRVDSIGHPTDSSVENGLENYTSIYEIETGHNFSYITHSANGVEITNINLDNIIQAQEDLLVKEISRVLSKIDEIETNHRAQFGENLLSEILKGTQYNIQVLDSSEDCREHAKLNFEELKESYDEFKKKYQEMFGKKSLSDGIQNPGIIDVINEIEERLLRIEEIIMTKDPNEFTELDVYVESIDKRFSDLREMAKEVDEEFSTSKE
jgi:hypothetical protein